MSETARAAWIQKFGSRHVQLERNDPQPLESLAELGSGGWGNVQEAALGTTTVAVKRMTFTKRSIETKREIEILQHLSRLGSHRHIVQLVGSYDYIQKRRGSYEIGFAMWPVARCDLAHFMQELDLLQQIVGGTLPHDHDEEDVVSAIDLCSDLTGQTGALPVEALQDLALSYLKRSFGCIAGAVEWLHNKARVRHKDLKPSQVLLSHKGLWLTDFGLSSIFSEGRSSTTGFDRATKRYEAPERAAGVPRGRPEDIFALGCMFLEMSYRLFQLPLTIIFGDNNKKQGWSYQANSRQYLHNWTKPLDQCSIQSQYLPATPNLIEAMMAHRPDERPTIALVSSYVLRGGAQFLGCCSPRPPFVAPHLGTKQFPDGTTVSTTYVETGPAFVVAGFGPANGDLHLGWRFPQPNSTSHLDKVNIFSGRGLGIRSSG